MSGRFFSRPMLPVETASVGLGPFPVAPLRPDLNVILDVLSRARSATKAKAEGFNPGSGKTIFYGHCYQSGLATSPIPRIADARSVQHRRDLAAAMACWRQRKGDGVTTSRAN